MVDTQATLAKDISNNIIQRCKQGYQCYDQGDLKGALRYFYSAWTLLPKPQSQWQEAGWVLTALGDAYFAKGDYEYAREALLSALHCPKAKGNPIIHLRLGQCQHELGERKQAVCEFQQVIKNGGQALFNSEPKKYANLLDEASAS